MKKYIILLTVFVIAMSGILITVKMLDKHYGIESSGTTSGAGSYSGESGNVTIGSVHGEETVHQLISDQENVDNPEGSYVNQYEIIISGKFDNDDWKKRQGIGMTNESIAATMSANEGFYAYDHMGDDKQQLYAEILIVLQNRAVDIPLCSNNPKDIEDVTAYVLLDHPEIFYMDGYTYEKYMFAGNIQKIDYTPNYTMTEEEIAQAENQIAQYVDQCIKDVPQSATEYEKVKYVYDYVILNTEYKLEAPENQNICSVFIYRQSVCLGYAKAVQYLLQRLDVDTTVVTGTVFSGEGHAWNMVKIGGQYYYVDATWGDASYQSDVGDKQSLSTINYDYLCVTTMDISQTHIFTHPITLPNCISQIDNYYVKEGLYLVNLDSLTLEHIFDEAYKNKQEVVSIRCANQGVYNDFQSQLLDEQQIFQYLSSDTSTLAYTCNDKLFTYTFML